MHPARVPSQDDVLQAFRRAGLASLTPTQERLIPLVLKGRDVAVEVRAGAGTTTACVAPLVLGLRGAGLAPRAVILSPSAQDMGKVSRAFTRFARVVRDAPAFVPLGEIEDARREQRRLERGATIVAGTVERVIDHIRRGSLGFKELMTIVVTEPGPDALADFIKDVQFIFAKFVERPQVILLSRSPLTEDNELLRLLHHPVTLSLEEKGGAPGHKPEHLVFSIEGGARAELLSRVFLGMRLASAIVFHSPRTDWRKIADTLRAHGVRVAALSPGQGGGRQFSERRAALHGLSRRTLDAVLVPLGSVVSAPDFEEAAPSHLVYLDLPSGAQRFGGSLKGATVLALVDRGQEKDLARLQEAIGVAFTKGNIPSDDEVVTGAIDRVLRRLKEEDQSELTLLRGRIRKQVPLLLRPLFMASLLKSQLPGLSVGLKPRPPAVAPQPAAAPEAAISRGQRGRFGRNTPDAAVRSPRPSDSQKPPRAEARRDGGYTQLFVSVGRNRRVYARDLTALFTEKLHLAAGDIGGVRVFEKYSFVDIAPGRAEEAIAQVSGTEVKGRAITVNYAKKKEEKEEK